MFIVMHCGGMKFNGQTIKESSLGGSETAAYYMALELTKQGHKVTLFTNSQETGTFDGVKYEWMGNQTEDAPLGDRFTFYASNTPHDINIIQRHPRAYERRWASKINLWWLHDLAFVRDKQKATGQMWNIDRILCVSEFHKKQVIEAWGIEASAITAITNGIDLSLFSGEIGSKLVESGKSLLYSSRPERGLINLVGEGGIMERLQVIDPTFHLYVCGYENTTQEMAQFYEFLNARCDKLPNVTRLGALTKQELANTMRQCSALVYSTEFEEVSCITAMEAMAAGLPFVSSEYAALPETCKDSGSILIPLKNGKVDIEAFVSRIPAACLPKSKLRQMQLDAAKKYTWGNAARLVENDIKSIFADHGSERARAFHFMRHSDIIALEHCNLDAATGGIAQELRTEYDKAYAFYRDDTYAEHYASYYQYEKDRGVNYGPEDVTGTSRYQAVSNMVAALPAGSRVLDYGCAHGHYTVNLAKNFLNLTFIGADLAQSNVDTARKWATDEGLTNIEFHKVDSVDDANVLCNKSDFDLIIAAEIIEHVGDPQHYVDALASYLTMNGKMVLTTPYGPWEAQGYREHSYWRAHLHHFERQDLHEMLGHHPDFKILAAPSGMSQFSTPLGSYITSFSKPVSSSNPIDYKRKLAETMPDQTVSCCMIVKDAEVDLRRCLESVLPFVQEMVIGVDVSTKDNTMSILGELQNSNPLVAWTIFELPKVNETGFAAARNATLNFASGDWILWIDADEVLVNGQALSYYLRNNEYNGYAVKQHHFSTEPMAVIKIDLPCRLFRNNKGIKFFGRVHEHPEFKMNDGLGPVMLLPKVEIAHYGYKTEKVRQQRFARNIGLLAKDREELPDRILGKFLWIRDLAQMCQYDIDAGRVDIELFNKRADEGIKLWEELLTTGNNRITIDALPFYSKLVDIKGNGFEFGFAVDASKLNGGAHVDKQPVVQGIFLNKDHAQRLMIALANDKIEGFDSRYF